MNIEELLASKHESSTYEISGYIVGNFGANFDFIPEATIDLTEMVKHGFVHEDWAQWKENTEVQTLLYKDFDFDGKRGWRLASMWYKGKPFMITQSAGRYLDDFNKKFVLCKDTYNEAAKYLRTLVPAKPTELYVGEITPLGSECVTDNKTTLTTFYGESLNGYFQKY
jgi:hypothetical protein